MSHEKAKAIMVEGIGLGGYWRGLTSFVAALGPVASP
jgi:hypothetical protein